MSDFNREQAEFWADKEADVDSETGLRVARPADQDWAKEHLRRALAEISHLTAEVQRVGRERDAYRKAKQENDERFMNERDSARAEVESLRSRIKCSCETQYEVVIAERDEARKAADAEYTLLAKERAEVERLKVERDEALASRARHVAHMDLGRKRDQEAWFARRDEMEAELARMRPVYEAAVRFPDSYGGKLVEPPGDWACKECKPYSDWPHVDNGWQCPVHALLSAIDTALTSHAKAHGGGD